MKTCVCFESLFFPHLNLDLALDSPQVTEGPVSFVGMVGTGCCSRVCTPVLLPQLFVGQPLCDIQGQY